MSKVNFGIYNVEQIVPSIFNSQHIKTFRAELWDPLFLYGYSYNLNSAHNTNNEC